MTETCLRGIPASGGIAVGPAHRIRSLPAELPPRQAGAFEDEWRSFEQARRAAAVELGELRSRVATRVGDKEAAIFEAHQVMLDDPMLADRVRERLRQNAPVERAVMEAATEIADRLAALADATFASRSADVLDVGKRLVRILLGRPPLDLSGLREPAVIVAEDLTPSDTAGLDPMMTLGFCTAGGGLTSHTAILARTLGLPAVVGLGEASLESVADGDELILDGGEGLVWVAPSAARVSDYRRRQQASRRRAEAWRSGAHAEAHTADGRRVEVAANVGDLASARQASSNGAEGIGLLRTEFLFLGAGQPPSEDEQRAAYAGILEAIGEKPVIIRTLDVGGDKPPSYLSFPKEMNPFLGWRAIRVSLERTDLFTTQVRAILRAAVGHDVRIMLPMVSAREEVQRARELVSQAEADLEKEGRSFARGLPLGIMVETPAAALTVDGLAQAADFFSIGTNDLTQYTLAVDRGNARVAPLFQPLHPAVLRLIRSAIDAAHAAGKWIGMCGELASMCQAIPILVGLGLDEFSMAPGSIPEAKALIALLDSGSARRLADEVLGLGATAEIEARMEGFLSEIGWAPRA
ncbi:MAG TPA: phosphoenolpyruvate--protein phosphotransferase [Anaerolineales bacterium]|nr:phosphoenolpyruvate--protein phosphotransferase [Anaerolineales bacterium]